MRRLGLYILLLVTAAGCGSEGDMSPNQIAPNQQGTGGSLAKFTLSNGYLYAVDSYQLLTFDLSDPMSPHIISSANVSWDVETIFAMDTLLFIGTRSGMHIYGINKSGVPNYLSDFQHVVSCDPVVAQDTLAYVTLRSENLCREGADVLEILDIRDLRNPVLIHRQDMINPHGLGVQDSLLFITEGLDGVKVFDVNAANDLDLLDHITGISAFDVIPGNNLLIVTGPDGIHQFDYSDPKNLKLLSTIPVEVD